jgi:predicted Zn-dependent protease
MASIEERLDEYQAALIAAYEAEMDARVPVKQARALLDSAWQAVLRAETDGASIEQINERAGIAFELFLARYSLSREAYYALLAESGRTGKVRR